MLPNVSEESFSFIFRVEDWPRRCRQKVPPHRWKRFARLHDVTSQRTEILKTSVSYSIAETGKAAYLENYPKLKSPGFQYDKKMIQN
jgi:hypothetical protein